LNHISAHKGILNFNRPYTNPITFFSRSGRISLDDMAPVEIDQRQTWEDNSVLRGQTPVVG